MIKIGKLVNSIDISLNGNKPCDIYVKDDSFYTQVLHDGSIGLGESYMHNKWGCNQLNQFFFQILSANIDEYHHIYIRLFYPIKISSI